MKLRRWMGALASAALVSAAGLSAGAQSVYSFGDSLSDTGNVKSLTFGEAGGLPYTKGRFSNGLNWADLLSFAIAGEEQKTRPGLLGSAFTSYSEGFNFAHAGSVANYDNLRAERALGFDPGADLLRVADAFVLMGQVRHFRDSKRLFGGRTYRAGADDFATISIGGNDYLNAQADPISTTKSAIDAMGVIRERGVVNFVVLDLPALGELPAFVFTDRRDGLNAVAAEHNALLRSRAAAFAAQRSARVDVIPLSELFAEVLRDADTNGGQRFGFTVVRPGAATSGTCAEDGLVGEACTDNYLFFDGRHPTKAMHKLIADLSLATLRGSATTAAEPALQVAAMEQARVEVDRIIGARLDALAFGTAISGEYSESAGRLGFREVSGHRGGAGAVNFYRFSAGDPAGFTPAPSPGASDLVASRGRLEEGEQVIAFGLDARASPRLSFGAIALTSDRTRSADRFRQKRDVRAMAAYGSWQEGPLRIDARLQGGASEIGIQRATGFGPAPLATGTARGWHASARLDGRRDLGIGPFPLAAKASFGITHLQRDAYRERAELDLVERDVDGLNQTGGAFYAGLAAAGDRRLGPSWRGGARLDVGLLAATSDRIGFHGLIDNPLLLPEDMTQTTLLALDHRQATLGGRVRLRVNLADAAGLNLSADIDALAEAREVRSAVSLRAARPF
jgi:phospholipase/lecithinase/hemolysin